MALKFAHCEYGCNPDFRSLRRDSYPPSSHPANMNDAGWYLKEWREKAGLTMEGLADRAQTSPGQVSDLEKGKRRFNRDWLERFASALRIEPADLLSPPGGKSPLLIRVLGRAGANPDESLIYTTASDANAWAPLPPGGSQNAAAVEVVGDSMRGYADDGSLVYFEYQQTPPTPDMIGEIVVVETVGGQVLLKRLLKGSERGLYDLESLHGARMEDVRLRWAAHVINIVPPRQARRIIKRGAA